MHQTIVNAGYGGFGTHGRNLFWDVNNFGQNKLVFLDGALKIDLADVITEIECLFNQGNKAVLDGNLDFRAFFNRLMKSTRSLDREGLTTRIRISIFIS